MLGMATLSLTSCGDAADEITSLIFGRNFSPTDLAASGVSEESATIKWTASNGATSYTLEVFADDSLSFEGTPAQTITGLTDTQYKLTGLVYDTKYSVRVQALTEGDESKTSKWNGVYFRTSAQQIFENANTEDIADRSINLRWPAGEAVTKLVVYDADGNVVATRDLTAEEIAAGAATFNGLTPETKYTVRLYNGEKERGSKTFTTIADLNGATLVRTTDDLGELIANATDGEVFALYGGTHFISSETEGKAGAAKVNTNITIKGIYPTDVPTIQGRFEINDGASLTVNQVILDGSNNASGDQAFNFKTAGAAYGALDVQNTEIKNYEKGVFYFNVEATITAIKFDKCLIHDITCEGGDCFDARKGLVNQLTLSNSTIYNCAQSRDFIRMDKNSAGHAETSYISITNCTIDNVLNSTANKRIVYVRYQPADITIKNCLFSNTKAVFSNQSTTDPATYSGNAYYNAAGLTSDVMSTDGSTVLYEADHSGSTVEDPAYKDASNGDYTIGNEDVSKLGVGDPRWY